MRTFEGFSIFLSVYVLFNHRLLVDDLCPSEIAEEKPAVAAMRH